MICTSREQSERLLKCGISPNTADMSLVEIPYEFNDGRKITNIKAINRPYRLAQLSYREKHNFLPVWSLSAILDMMPPFTRLIKHPMGDRYVCNIIDFDCTFEAIGDTAIEACVKMIEWLSENGHFEKRKSNGI